MAGGVFDPSQEMPSRYLEIIESVVDATAVLRDHPLNAPDRPGPAADNPKASEVVGRADDVPTHPGAPAPQQSENRPAADSPGRASQALEDRTRTAPFVPQDASPSVLAQIRYMEEASRFEERLAVHLSEHEAVNEHLGTVVRNLWSRTPEHRRSEYGSEDTWVAGVVGTSIDRLQQVVDSGNLRERVAFLFNGVSHGLVPHLLRGSQEPAAEIRTERADRVPTEARVAFEERLKEIGESDLDPAAKEAAIEAASAELLRTRRQASQVRPPLSANERLMVGDGESLPWVGADMNHTLLMKSDFQQLSEKTGGLVRTGTSGSAYLFIHNLARMPRRWRGVDVDLGLLRLALLGAMLSADHHSFHEVMRGAQIALNEISDHDPALDYVDNWGRYRRLAPLSEDELRTAVAYQGRFPDEHARDLLDRSPAAPPHPAPKAPMGLRPGPRVPAAEVYPVDPAVTPNWVDRVTRAAQASIGSFRRVDSGPDPQDGWKIAGEADGVANDFARWIRGDGPAPNAASAMDIWEVFLFIAYWVGAVDKAWLDRTHEEMARAARNAYYNAIDTGMDDEDAFEEGGGAYFEALRNRMHVGSETRHYLDSATGSVVPDIPVGHLVHISSADHSGVALGARDENGELRLVGYWVADSADASDRTDSLRVITLDDLVERSGVQLTIESMAPAWSVPSAPIALADPPAEFDRAFGEPVFPGGLRARELDDQADLRLNPLWSLLEDVPPSVLTRNRKAVWLYTVRPDGRVVVGSETPGRLLGPEQLADLRASDPTLAELDDDAARETLDERWGRIGHPGIGADFAANGDAKEGSSRVSGEFRWDEELRQWVVDDDSGRYMYSRGAYPPNVARHWLWNAAALFSAHTGQHVGFSLVSWPGRGRPAGADRMAAPAAGTPIAARWPRPLTTDDYGIIDRRGTGVLFRAPGTPVFHWQVPRALVNVPSRPLFLVHAQNYVEVSTFARPRLRISEDRTLAVEDGFSGQQVFATAEAVARSSAELVRAGARVRLEVDRDLSIVLPIEDGGIRRLFQVTPVFPTESGQSTAEDSRDFADLVAGGDRPSSMVFRDPDSGRVASAPINASDDAEVTGTHHLAEALAQAADGEIRPEEVAPEWAAAHVRRDRRPAGGEGGPLPGERYGSALAVGETDDPRRDALSQAARRIGVNEYAWAEVGEGYVVQSIAAPDAQGRPSLAQNFANLGGTVESPIRHLFATVVLASEDGSHQITLENFSRSGLRDLTRRGAVQQTLTHYAADQLREMAEDLRAEIAWQEGAGLDPDPEVRAYLDLAEALIRAEGAGAEQEREDAIESAVSHMARIERLIPGEHQWRMRMFSKHPGESFHDGMANLVRSASPTVNPLTGVVVRGHRDMPTSDGAPAGSATPGEKDGPGTKADVLASADWLDRRAGAPVARVATERFDPKIDFSVDGKAKASGWETLIRANVQRIQAGNGRWVRRHVLALPVKPMFGVTGGDVDVLANALQRALDQYVNRGYELPRSKDRLHVDVRLAIARDHAEAIEIRPGRTADAPDLELDGPDARHWGLLDFTVVLLHEVLHYLGLRDEYRDPSAVFRRAMTSSAAKADGPMTDGVFDLLQEMPKRLLGLIESVVDATAVLRDHPLGAPGSPAPGADDPEALKVVGRADDAPAHPGASAPPHGPSAGSAAQEGVDLRSGWRALSSMPGRSRSSELRAIDRAVEALPPDPTERDLRRVLRAVSDWKAGKSSRSSRWDAVIRLESAVRRLLNADESHRSSAGPARAPSAPGAAYGRRPADLQNPALAGRGRAVTVEGDGPAVGFEAELHGFRVVLPAGDDPEEYGTIVTRPGLLKIVFDKVGGVPILEVVVLPTRVLAGARDDGRAERAEVLAAFEDVVRRLEGAPDGRLLSRIFTREAGYEVDPLAANLPVRRNLAGQGVMLVHHTATAPLSGLTGLMRHVAERMRTEARPFQLARQDLLTGLEYAAWGASRYDAWLAADPAYAASSRPEDREDLEGALALGFTQVAATVRGRLSSRVLPKDFSAVTSRPSLAAVRSGLGEAPQAFLEDMAGMLRDGFVRFVARRAGIQDPAPLSWPLPHDWGRSRATIGQYLDNLLLGEPERVIGQHEALAVRTDSRVLDGNPVDGVPRIVPHVVPVEARPLASAHSDLRTVRDEFETLADVSLRLFNRGRGLYGLPPVGGPLPPPGRRVDDYLLLEVNARLRDEFGWTGGWVGRERVERALAEMSGVRTDPRGRATEVAYQIVFGRVLRDRSGARAPEPEAAGSVERASAAGASTAGEVLEADRTTGDGRPESAAGGLGMADPLDDDSGWRKSSHSEGDCVEVVVWR
ncbi:hypothetical protein AB0L00_45630 [Actinoallomurus sp. NPDC052308]|uniref:hypothetical protein n=1 Tax=Actinoallomurus sp. NPDC052308 TaxID=3155530 RepID=UPI0034232750